MRPAALETHQRRLTKEVGRSPVPVVVTHLHGRFQFYMFHVGRAFGCHQIPDRSFSWRGRQIPLCARCSGVLIGPLFVPLYYYFGNPLIATVCLSAFLVDVLSQLVGLRESNNWLRLVTGVGFSASVLFLLTYGVRLCLLNTKH